MLPFSPQELQKANSSKKGNQGASDKTSFESNTSSVPLFLQYPVPYTQDVPAPLLVSQSPSKLHFGNPYSSSDSKGRSPFQNTPFVKKKIHSFNLQSLLLLSWQMREMRSSQRTSCLGYPLWAHPPGTVMWCASNPPATPAGQKATKSQKRSKTTTM